MRNSKWPVFPGRSVQAAAVFFIFLVLVPCSSQARELTDVTGRKVQVPEQVERVVSLAPSITELVYALDRGDTIKGTAQFSDHPPKAADLPRVGPYSRPDLERILSLAPDLVLAIRDGNPRHTIERLESLNIPVFAVDSGNIQEIMQSIQALGEVLGAMDKADELVRDMRERMDHVQKQAAKKDSRPAILFQVDSDPVIGAGNSTFIHEMIHLAGGTNVLADMERYPRLGWEDILRMDPEVVIIASMAGGRSSEKLLQSWHRWPQLRAVQNSRVHVVDADIFERPTHRLMEGLDRLAQIIHPELFSEDHGH